MISFFMMWFVFISVLNVLWNFLMIVYKPIDRILKSTYCRLLATSKFTVMCLSYLLNHIMVTIIIYAILLLFLQLESSFCLCMNIIM